jgi:hypothetical protein
MPRVTDRQADIQTCRILMGYCGISSDDETAASHIESRGLSSDESDSDDATLMDARLDIEIAEAEADMELEIEDVRMIAVEMEAEAVLLDAECDITLENGGTISDINDDESLHEFARRRLEQLLSHRYRFRLPYRRENQQIEWFRMAIREDGRNFRSMFRMDPHSFEDVVRTLGTHDVFQSRGTKPQKPALLQIAIAVYHFGGTISKHRTAQVFGISPGSVQKYVERFITAVLSLLPEYIVWPKPHTAEYKRVTDMHFLQYGFPNCLGFVDGSLVPLWRKPSGEEGGYYFTRKKFYALNLSIIVDGDARILWAVAGRMTTPLC